MWNERSCENSDVTMSVIAKIINSLQATTVLQAEWFIASALIKCQAW